MAEIHILHYGTFLIKMLNAGSEIGASTEVKEGSETKESMPGTIAKEVVAIDIGDVAEYLRRENFASKAKKINMLVKKISGFNFAWPERNVLVLLGAGAVMTAAAFLVRLFKKP